MESCQTSESIINSRWSRDEKEDLKLAIDLFYELQSKLKTFHPQAEQAFRRLFVLI